jgi:hypothetical protein
MKGHIRHMRLRHGSGWSGGVIGCCSVWGYSTPWGALAGGWRMHTRYGKPTRVRPLSRSCIKWHPNISGRPAQPGDLLEILDKDGGHGAHMQGVGSGSGLEGGMIPARLSAERMERMRQAMAEVAAGRVPVTGREPGPIVLYMEEASRLGKPNLVRSCLGEMIAQGRAPMNGCISSPGHRSTDGNSGTGRQ